jgi:hypothetical protein
MANEITVQAKLTAAKNGASITNATSSKTQTMESTLEKLHHTVQDVGTTTEAVGLGDVAVADQHWILLRNLDATNFVTVHVRKDVTPTDTVAGVMLPGESFGPVRAGAQSGGYPHYRMTADTAACDVEVLACDAGDPAA